MPIGSKGLLGDGMPRSFLTTCGRSSRRRGERPLTGNGCNELLSLPPPPHAFENPASSTSNGRGGGRVRNGLVGLIGHTPLGVEPQREEGVSGPGPCRAVLDRHSQPRDGVVGNGQWVSMGRCRVGVRFAISTIPPPA